MREIQCKRCFFFTPEWCPKKRDSLDPDLIRDCQYFRIKTNADRIRNMSDEELATMMSTIYRTQELIGGDVQMWREWLKQECDDNGT